MKPRAPQPSPRSPPAPRIRRAQPRRRPGTAPAFLIGGPGSGKTAFALQPRQRRAPRRSRYLRRVRGKHTPDHRQCRLVRLGLPALARNKLFLWTRSSRPRSSSPAIQPERHAGHAQGEEGGDRREWIVFDGIDVLLTLLQNPIAEMREIYRIRDWLAVTSRCRPRTSIRRRTGHRVSRRSGYDGAPA